MCVCTHAHTHTHTHTHTHGQKAQIAADMQRVYKPMVFLLQNVFSHHRMCSLTTGAEMAADKKRVCTMM